MPKSKKKGLGVAGFFDEPTNFGEDVEVHPIPAKLPVKKKIRKTYVVYEETQLALEWMKMNESTKGNKVTLSDLLNTSVKCLLKEKGLELPDRSTPPSIIK